MAQAMHCLPTSSIHSLSLSQSASSLLLSVQNLEKFTRMAGNGSINKAHMILNMTDSEEEQQQHHHHLFRSSHKAKDTDQMSIASSNHFTLINGCGRSANLKSQNSFCRHGRQITVLIVTMTTVFTFFILGILYLMDRKYFLVKVQLEEFSHEFLSTQDEQKQCPLITNSPKARIVAKKKSEVALLNFIYELHAFAQHFVQQARKLSEQ